MDRKKLPKIQQEDNPYDPVNTALREGRLYGIGIRGSYRKNFLTRIGFVLIGSLFLCTGAILIFTDFFYVEHVSTFTNNIIRYGKIVFSCVTIYIGIIIILKTTQRKSKY